MRSVEAVGRTVEEAIAEALDQLKIQRDQAQIEVIDEGTKGIFGLIGTKLARVRVTIKDQTVPEPGDTALKPETEEAEGLQAKAEWGKNFLTLLVAHMGVQAEVTIVNIGDYILLELSGENMGLLIGRRGQTLDAIQYLVNLAAAKAGFQGAKFMVDAEDYRKRRQQALEQLAERLASKVISRRRKAVLDPMSPMERRIIHLSLRDNPKVCTYSEGKEPYRRVVIDLKK
ncbi:MAG: protein jag [Firmicutes bacterium]|nr:protein jag [Bacillota bacterium]